MILFIENYNNLHEVLRDLYDNMMPLCQDMARIAKVIAGVGALLYIGARVWQSLARAEPIDIYPLLRPFALGLCILFFPIVLDGINGILSPVVLGANSILKSQELDMTEFRKQRDELERQVMLRNPETAYLVSDEVFDKEIDNLGWSPSDMMTIAGMYIKWGVYEIKRSVREGFVAVLEAIFYAIGLIIDTLRTFFLVVLSILGPLVFAIACYDGLQATLMQWFARYITIYLWLPVSDLFSAILARIQVLMVQKDMAALSDPSYVPDGSSDVYIVFMLIGIIGYFAVPTVASWIVQSGGVGSYGSSVNKTANYAGGYLGGAMGASSGNVMGELKK
ncbi:conjugative transposon protein TraJ [Butyricimonas paravirosa]|uniref:conjugative transposon protein TraJ n=1 Tax=Butyricimonas paravirosa TaxID=1472417 RepID=UPI00210DD2BC|nr:conjugative transposon protein TraJ [Butyricimonas paravirosa]MCQ4875655.1 conjugative transposon protein TraJ [Butyricimonas paravirosa]